MATVRGFSTAKARTYILRLPLFTRALVLVIFLLALLSLPGFWDIQAWGSLIPSKVSLFAGNASYQYLSANSSKHLARNIKCDCVDTAHGAFRK
ncbi:hypothetical protein IF1G_02415 [Cordyceps javanica]|uniref:Uncharacterized protein n=1 Tax=Cordyceps javanica TaxID=43265 RepID=A0A545V9D5_9HYPO|nr:hypothetical protein IF1G_02415 [Cordyceps javanica]TQW09552.1 hypothetical protein IF2G_02342 [Cordyceps javanica]